MIEHVVVYRNEHSYSGMPDMAKLSNGELVVVFREAQRRQRITHLDSSSRATLVRSSDEGRTWDGLVVVAEGGLDVGIQDPSICQLRDGRLICNYFKWQVIGEEPYGAECLGTFVVTSADGGKSWTSGEVEVGRSPENGTWISTSDAVLELPTGDLLVPVYENNLATGDEGGHRAFLRRSTDGGQTWHAWGTIGYDPLGHVDFEEPALVSLPSGKLLCMLREDRRKESLWQSESHDGGATWSTPRRTRIWGYPAHLLLLSSGRVLCTYGYRRSPYGVRACLSDNEGRTCDLEHELVIRADGIGTDLGYPSSVQLADGTIFTTYYFTEPDPSQRSDVFQAGGLRYVAGSFYPEW